MILAQSQYTDRDLIEALQGDESRSAFRQIFDRYQNKLLLYTMTIVKSEGVAKDLVQEAFVRLWMNRETIDRDGSLGGYLYTIARNLSLNYLKHVTHDRNLKNRLWQMMQGTEDRFDLDEESDDDKRHRLIQQAIRQMPPRRQLIFRLSREEGYTHVEIADKLNISKNTVKNHVVAALKDIKAYLETHFKTTF